MKRHHASASRAAVAGLATAGSLLAAVAGAALILGSGLSLEQWPSAGRPEHGAALGLGLPELIGSASPDRPAPRASASGAATPAAGLAAATPPAARQGAANVARPVSAAGEISSRRLAAHVPEGSAAGRPPVPAPQAGGLARWAAGLEATGDATGARVAGAGGEIGAVLAPASPRLGRTVARAGAGAGAAMARVVRSATAIIRRLRPPPSADGAWAWAAETGGGRGLRVRLRPPPGAERPTAGARGLETRLLVP